MRPKAIYTRIQHAALDLAYYGKALNRQRHAEAWESLTLALTHQKLGETDDVERHLADLESMASLAAELAGKYIPQ